MSALVLVVDDEPDVTDLFRRHFRRELRVGRFAMVFAHSAAEALVRLAVEDGSDLILLFSDVNMPGMTGLELLSEVRARRPDVPVVMITAYGDGDTYRVAMDRGASAVLSKPIDFGLLRLEVERRLSGPA